MVYLRMIYKLTNGKKLLPTVAKSRSVLFLGHTEIACLSKEFSYDRLVS